MRTGPYSRGEPSNLGASSRCSKVGPMQSDLDRTSVMPEPQQFRAHPSLRCLSTANVTVNRGERLMVWRSRALIPGAPVLSEGIRANW